MISGQDMVIFNNSSFGLITLEAESVGLPSNARSHRIPTPDFPALARACGGHGFSARKPTELEAAVGRAFAIDGPAIVDALVVSDKLPESAAPRPGCDRALRCRKDQAVLL
jgi:thiamine pyrophosphate-dependent acetolactate synthase large subunit-like protein